MKGFERLSLAGKTAIVTGAGLGMGRATAMLLAARGAKVVVSDLREDAGKETVAKIEADGGAAVFVRADASKEAEVEALVAAAVARFGKLDCAVNNAAITPDTHQIGELDFAEVDKVLSVNLRGVLVCMHYEIAAMLKTGGGSIVNIGSVSSFRPQAGNVGYNAAKHGVIGLTKTGAVEYAGRNIRVNAVLPGAIDTPMIRQAMSDINVTEEVIAPVLSLFGRLGQPEEVAEASAWFCSDASSFATGSMLAVDAGYLAR